MVELAVTLHRSRNLETRGAQQSDPLANLAVQRNHHFRPEQAVVPRRAARGVGDVVPEEVVWPERRSGHPERGARDLVVHQYQPVGDHVSTADRAQQRVRVHHLDTEIRPGLQDRGQAISKPLQVVDDVRTVTEEARSEYPPAYLCGLSFGCAPRCMLLYGPGLRDY